MQSNDLRLHKGVHDDDDEQSPLWYIGIAMICPPLSVYLDVKRSCEDCGKVKEQVLRILVVNVAVCIVLTALLYIPGLFYALYIYFLEEKENTPFWNSFYEEDDEDEDEENQYSKKSATNKRGSSRRALSELHDTGDEDDIMIEGAGQIDDAIVTLREDDYASATADQLE